MDFRCTKLGEGQWPALKEKESVTNSRIFPPCGQKIDSAACPRNEQLVLHLSRGIRSLEKLYETHSNHFNHIKNNLNVTYAKNINLNTGHTTAAICNPCFVCSQFVQKFNITFLVLFYVFLFIRLLHIFLLNKGTFPNSLYITYFSAKPPFLTL